MEQPQDILPTPIQDQEQPQAEEEQPTKSVENFWERLDAVFKQNNDMKEKFEELLANFPSEMKPQGVYKSYIFQPDRLALCSNDDVSLSEKTAANYLRAANAQQGHAPTEQFSQFRIRLKRPLRNVKSIQLLSAVIPNAIQSIPDTNIFFLYYRLRSVANANKGVYNNATIYKPGDIVTFNALTWAALTQNVNVQPTGININQTWVQITLPADTTRPNYFDLAPENIQYVYLQPTYHWTFDQSNGGNDANLFNRTFQDANDLVNALNYIASQPTRQCAIQNDISFQYNPTLNKIIVVPNPANITAGYYYLPCGYEDPNVTTFFIQNLVYGFQGTPPDLESPFTDWGSTYLQYSSTLNYKLGFTWNGLFPNPRQSFSPNPWGDQGFLASVYWYLRKQDPGYVTSYSITQNQVTANNYLDLVNTSCVRLYADFAFSTTEDSLGTNQLSNIPSTDGLLSIVPVNTINLGVGFYQNNFDNPLTKIPQNFAEIGISMLTDQGYPFYLPNSANVLLELGITYH